MNRVRANHLLIFVALTVLVSLLVLPDYFAGASSPLQADTIIETIRLLRLSQAFTGETARPGSFEIKEIPVSAPVTVHPAAYDGEKTFKSIADATVIQGYPAEAFGDTIDMGAGYDPPPSLGGYDMKQLRALVKFNIGSLPSGVEITNATLRLRVVTSADYPGESKTIITHRVKNSWNEKVTWNKKPAYAETYGSRSIKHDGSFPWVEFDVTGLVEKWYEGSESNHGILLRATNASSANPGWRGFGTRESKFKPELIIEYRSKDVPTATSEPTTTRKPTATSEPTATIKPTATSEPAASATPTAPVPVSKAEKAYLPYISEVGVVRVTPTPSPTPAGIPEFDPCPSDSIEFNGSTDQNRPVRLCVAEDKSSVYLIQINYSINCGDEPDYGAKYVWHDSSNPPIVNQSFEVDWKSNSRFEMTGEFTSDYETAAGTWQGVLVKCSGLPGPCWVDCRGPLGQWSANR